MTNNVLDELKGIRVLILEDSAEDAELMVDELERGGFMVNCVVTSDAETFSQEMAGFFPDLVLADYSLPEITGLEALSIAMGVNSSVPFIFVTGTVGEEIAAETILNGASGLVLKSNLNVLGKVVKEAVENNRRWHNKRLEWTSRRIHARIQSNIEALDRIQDFLNRNSTPMNISNDVEKTLSDLKKLQRNIVDNESD